MQRAVRVAIHQITTGFPAMRVKQSECSSAVLSYLDSHPHRNQKLIDWTEGIFRRSGIQGKNMAFHPNEIHRGVQNSEEVEEKAFHKAVDLAHDLTRQCLNSAGLKMRGISKVYVGGDFGAGQSIESYTHIIENGNPQLKTGSVGDHGCATGALMLADAYDYLQGHPDQAVQVIALDFYSRFWTRYRAFIDEKIATYDTDKKDKEDLRHALVSAALLGDAGCSIILLGEKHPLYKESVEVKGSLYICGAAQENAPGTVDAVGFVTKPYGKIPLITQDVTNNGVMLVRDAITELRRKYTMPSDFDFHAIHSGGVRVLQAAEESLGIPHSHLQFGYDTLFNHGNCASPTLFLQLQLLENSSLRKPIETGVAAAMGLGMKAVALYIRRQTPMLL